MTQPDPAFIEFFSADYKSKSEWQKLLDAVEIPGMDNPTWDRRAAYLLWIMGGHYDAETPWHWRDVMRQVVMPNEPAPPRVKLSEVIDRIAAEERAAIVGSINPIEDADCQPTPGGVSFTFDAVKVSGDK
jgi:hypothetical protein